MDVDIEGNGLDGWRKLETEQRPDCLVLDLMLPGIPGAEIIQQVRSHARLENLPIIVLSAKVSREAHSSVLTMGVNCFLAKPFEIQVLEKSVLEVLQCR